MRQGLNLCDMLFACSMPQRIEALFFSLFYASTDRSFVCLPYSMHQWVEALLIMIVCLMRQRVLFALALSHGMDGLP